MRASFFADFEKSIALFFKGVYNWWEIKEKVVENGERNQRAGRNGRL